MITYVTEPDLVAASAAAAGAQAISNPDRYRQHRCVVTISLAATVVLEGSIDGTRYVAASGQLTATGGLSTTDVWPYLRVSWSGNTGTVTVDHIATDDMQVRA